jgi:hypothetical protein
MTDLQPLSDESTRLQSSNDPLDRGALFATDPTPLPLTERSPLAVIFNTAGKDNLMPGSTFTLSVTVSNKGQQSAVIDITLDALSAEIRQWYAPGQERLALGAEQSNEVIFQFHVPVGALPGLYTYAVVVDAQEHYPEDTPLRFTHQIQVLTALEDTVRESTPTFVLQPPTRSTAPVLLQPGEVLQLQVMVNNRSDRVDRFRLMCPDFPKEWYSVVYPSGGQGLGLVVQSDCLNLNPDEQGLILWTITPPLNTLAGIYVPSLRLYSDNFPDLMLLDLVYLQVLPTYLLQPELRTLTGRVKRQAGVFQVRFNNAGNTPRAIALSPQPQDEGESCTYTLAQSTARIPPQETLGVELQVLPRKPWQRPFTGGRVFNFTVGLEDVEQHPLPIDNLPGILFWEPRPWWHLLSAILLGLLILLAIAYGIWRLFFRTPPPLKILEFYPENSAYAAENGDVVRLGWQISQPKRVQSIMIQSKSPEGNPLTRPDVYDFSQGVPSALAPFCQVLRERLTCRHYRTSARKAGTYLFEMTVQSNGKPAQPPLLSKADPVQIAPIPLPQIVSLGATQPTYQEKNPVRAIPLRATPRQRRILLPSADIRLNWTVTLPARLQEVRLMGRDLEGKTISPLRRFNFQQGLPVELQSACKLGVQLVCKNVPTGATLPGDYTFELSAIPKPEVGQTIATKKSEPIKVLPRPTQIVTFSLNGQPAKPSYLMPILRQKMPPLQLSWRVEGGQGTKVSLVPFPGHVPLQGRMPIILSPTPGSNTISLQAISPAGEQISRSVTLTTYDPNPTNPEKVAAAAATAASAQIAKAQQEAAAAQQQAVMKQSTAGGATAQPTFRLPSSTPPPPLTPDSLTPLEAPPKLDRR